MIVVWGFKTYVKLLGIVTFVCGSCHTPAAQRVVEQVRKFTFFWIPLFPVKRETLASCTYCGTVSSLTKEEAAALINPVRLEPAGQVAPSAAGALELPASDLPSPDNRASENRAPEN